MATKSRSTRKQASSKKFLEEHKDPGPVLILGTDHLRTEELCKKVLTQWGADINDPSSVAPVSVNSLPRKSDGLKDLFCSISLFSQASFFIVRKCHELSASHGKVLSETLLDLPAEVGVVITGEKLPGTGALKRTAAKQGWLFELGELGQADLVKWTTQALKKRGVLNPDSSALSTLIDISDHSLNSLSGLVEHLALFLNASKASPYTDRVSKADVLDVFIVHPDPNEFALVDTALSGNPARIECQIRSLVAAGKSEFRLLGLVARALSQYSLVHTLKQEGKNDAQIRASLKLPPSIASKVVSAALRVSPEQLKVARQEIVRTDSLFKNRSLGEEIVLNNLCHKIAG